MASWIPSPGVARSLRALAVKFVRQSRKRYQPRGHWGGTLSRATRGAWGSRRVSGARWVEWCAVVVLAVGCDCVMGLCLLGRRRRWLLPACACC